MFTKSILMASFVDRDDIYFALEKISNEINIEKNNIFVFKNTGSGDYIFTYNLHPEKANIKFSSIWKNTISIHRKKNTNTLYSLNAMNELIKSKNRGVLNKGYKIKWDNYENQMLIIKNGKLEILDITLIKINQ